MIEQSGTYTIEHDTDKVFEYISKPKNLSEISPTIEKSTHKGKSENGGDIIEAEYAVAGGIASGKTVLNPEKYVENKVIKYTIDDDIRGYIKWEFKSVDKGTELRYNAEYEVTIPVPNLFLNTIGQTISQKEVDNIIQNLRSELKA